MGLEHPTREGGRGGREIVASPSTSLVRPFSRREGRTSKRKGARTRLEERRTSLEDASFRFVDGATSLDRPRSSIGDARSSPEDACARPLSRVSRLLGPSPGHKEDLTRAKDASSKLVRRPVGFVRPRTSHEPARASSPPPLPLSPGWGARGGAAARSPRRPVPPNGAAVEPSERSESRRNEAQVS